MGSIYAIKQKKNRKKSILCRVTTGLPGKDLCRVLNPSHTAKVPFFAVCCGLWHTAKLPCLPCVKALGTRQSACATVSCRHRLFFAECRVMHTAKVLPCARQKTHGKEGLCQRLVAVGLLPCATRGKAFVVCKPGFAVCLWHIANSLCPIVMTEQ